MIQGEGGATLEAYSNDLAYLKRKVHLINSSHFFFLINLTFFEGWVYNLADQEVNIYQLDRLMLVLTLLSLSCFMILISFSSLSMTAVRLGLHAQLFLALCRLTTTRVSCV